MLCGNKNFHAVHSAVRLVALRSVEIVTLDQVKDHLRLTHDLDDEYLSGLIRAARSWSENYCARAFVQQDLEMILDQFPQRTQSMDCHIYLKKSPVISVAGIYYLDAQGVEQTLDPAAYYVDTHSVPARIFPAAGYSWPSTLKRAGAVRIEYVAGYASNADNTASIPDIEINDSVNQDVVCAQLLLIEHLYNNRSPIVIGSQAGEMPFSISALLNPYKVEGL